MRMLKRFLKVVYFGLFFGRPIKFRCNICGHHNIVGSSRVVDREAPSCSVCGSNLRFRSIVSVLTTRLFESSQVITEIENSSILGLGMSDSSVYSSRLSDAFDYTNSFYHQEPFLDITDVSTSSYSQLQFVISSDVFEHISRPVSVAFENARKLLAPGGIFIISVPYRLDGATVEHFPLLQEAEVLKRNDSFILRNVDSDGKVTEFDKLVFHGGPGTTLEMRVFSLPDLMSSMQSAGFSDIRIHDEDQPQFGIINKRKDSLVLSAVNPA